MSREQIVDEGEPDKTYMDGVVETLRGVAGTIATVMNQHGIKDTDANIVVGLRDGFAAAALLAELEPPDVGSA